MDVMNPEYSPSVIVKKSKRNKEGKEKSRGKM